MGNSRVLPEKKHVLSIILLLIFASLLLIGTITVSAGVNPFQYLKPAKAVTIITADGIWEVKTKRTLVAEILAEAKVSFHPKYEKSYPPLAEGLQSNTIIITRVSKIVLRVDGQELAVYSWAETVEDLLEEQGIVLEGDIINFSGEEKLKTGQVIEIVRVTSGMVSEDSVIASQTIYKNDSSLLVGTQKVQTQAREGKKRVTFEIIYHDSHEISRRIISEEVVVKPVTGVILKGTQALPARSAPKAPSDIVEGIASYYGAELHGNLTASGVPFNMHALTAAHRTLPFGTKVKVTFLATGKSVEVVINDRGPFIAGRIIDLSAAAAKKIGLYAHGIGQVRLEIMN